MDAGCTCVLPVAAQYPVIPDSVKARAAKQEAEFDRKSDAAWKKALPVVMEEAQKGRPYKPVGFQAGRFRRKVMFRLFPVAEGGGNMYTPGGRGGKADCGYFFGRHRKGPGKLCVRLVKRAGARVIVFNVSASYPFESAYQPLRAPYVKYCRTYRSGDGNICVTGDSFLVDTHDVIIRHMRFPAVVRRM